jgi:hypothetical protein
MIEAFMKNMSLEQVNFTSHFIGEDDQCKIKEYCDRNSCIDRWIEDPNAVPKSQFPRILTYVCYEYGNHVVFRGLCRWVTE